tara:strand:+ start:1053 stop:1526 length:474 start_codon:yes stop_codon:yes gene_type:complete
MNYKKHHLEETIEAESFSLIAIHTSLEDFQLAYFINKNCSTFFKRNHDLFSSHLKTSIKGMVWENSWDKDSYFHLFSNKYSLEKGTSELVSELFPGKVIEVKNLVLPEFREVNYFIKKQVDISDDSFIKKINKLPGIQFAYCVNENNIKSNKNIIFD